MKTAARMTATMIIAFVAVIGTMGFAMAGSTMDYTVNFDGVDTARYGPGSVDIFTFTPVGMDAQMVKWTNCEASGTQTGHYYNNGWMTIDRNTRIDTARANDSGTMNHGSVFGSIITRSALSTGDGTWTAGRVDTYAVLNDSYIGNPPEDYVDLTQYARLYDSDLRATDGRVGYEYIMATTGIDARLFDNGAPAGVDSFVAGVTTTTDATTNASSSISAMLSEGEIFMNVSSKLFDNETNVESSRTDFTIDVPNMPGYSEQNTGMFQGFAAIDGVSTDTMQTVFDRVDNINTTGYFYAVN